MPSIVIDASAIVDLVTGDPSAAAIAARLRGADLHAPQMIALEVAQSIRRLIRAGLVTDVLASRLFAAFRGMRIALYEHKPLLDRVWALRHNLTAYDASYVALAELLGAPLVTRDARLARSAGHGASIDLIA